MPIPIYSARILIGSSRFQGERLVTDVTSMYWIFPAGDP